MPAALFRTSLKNATSRRSGRRPLAPPAASRRRGQRLAGWLGRNRRLAAALLLCLAAGITVHQLTPPPAYTVTVFAAARDLPAGSSLAVQDLQETHIPPDLMADGAVRNGSEAAGKQLAAPLRKGQLVTDAQLLGPGLLAGTPPGSAAVPLRMADPSSIQLVSPGQLVNVVLTGANTHDQQSPYEVLASAVPVLWTSGQGGKTGQWLGTGETDGLIVVAASPGQAARLAGASTQGKLFFVLVGPQTAEAAGRSGG